MRGEYQYVLIRCEAAVGEDEAVFGFLAIAPPAKLARYGGYRLWSTLLACYFMLKERNDLRAWSSCFLRRRRMSDRRAG